MKQADKPKKLSRSDLARCYRVSLTTVDEWILAGLPGQKVGRAWQFDQGEVDAWRAERNGKTHTGLTITEARRRKILMDTELARHELRTLRREHIPQAQVAEVWCRLARNFKSRMLAIPTKLAGRLRGEVDAALIQRKIELEIIEALGELSSEGNFENFMVDLEHLAGERVNGADSVD